MSFPWVYSNAFDNLTTPFGWDSESDTGSLLDVVPYYVLARNPTMAMPYRGAACLRIRPADTNDHTLTEGDIDIADATTRWFRFYLWLSADFAATADDTFNLLELQQAGGTIECALGLRITAATDAVEIGIGDGIAPTDFAASALTKGEWHCIEWAVLISTGGAGTQDLYVDGSASLVALTTLTNAAAVGQGVLGTQGTLSTTTGTILIDQFVMDDLQIFRVNERFPNPLVLTSSAAVFVGPGTVDSVELHSGAGTDCIVTLFDTDIASINDAHGWVYQINNTANNEMLPSGDLSNRRFVRGCYAVLAGTNPRATITMRRDLGGPTCYSESGMRRYGLVRSDRQQNV